jgi:hypothetical protein
MTCPFSGCQQSRTSLSRMKSHYQDSHLLPLSKTLSTSAVNPTLKATTPLAAKYPKAPMDIDDVPMNNDDDLAVIDRVDIDGDIDDEIEKGPRIVQVPNSHLAVNVATGLLFCSTCGVGLEIKGEDSGNPGLVHLRKFHLADSYSYNANSVWSCIEKSLLSIYTDGNLVLYFNPLLIIFSIHRY